MVYTNSRTIAQLSKRRLRTAASRLVCLLSSDRKGVHPQSHLADFSGVLQADAYAGFNELYRED